MNDTTIQHDVLDALRSSATLVALRMTAWHPGRTDRDASGDVETSNNAIAGSTRVVKNRMAGADERLRAVHRLDQQIRLDHRALTTTWNRHGADDISGPRLLPNELFFKYMKRMNNLNGERQKLVQEVVDNWDSDVARARQNLGALADPLDYPAADAIASHFTMRLDYSPLPDTGGYAGLLPQAADLLSKSLVRRTHEHLQNAARQSYADVRAAAERLVRVLGADRPRIHESLITDAQDTLATLLGFVSVAGKVGLAEDAERLQTLHTDLSAALASVDLAGLRKSETAKAALHEKAKAITDKLSAWGL